MHSQLERTILGFIIRSSIKVFPLLNKQAAAVAARLAQSIGHTVNEEIKLPEKVAPLLSGRCGSDDELKAIQAQANCKITFSRETGSYKSKSLVNKLRVLIGSIGFQAFMFILISQSFQIRTRMYS